MALTLRVKAGQATFSIADGAMKAEWTLTTRMSEEEIFEALMGMMRYVRQQPVDTSRHLHAVADHVEERLGTDDQNLADWRAEQERERFNRLAENAAQEHARMSWRPAVQPPPLADSLEAAGQNGFELIPPDELD